MIIKRDMPYINGENRRLHIHLPNDYYETDEQYPVMYFFDGHNLYTDEDATYGTCWGLEDFLNSWYKPMIIVGIECSKTNRLSEYCPYDVTGHVFGDVDGIGDETMKWIINDIKPIIDRDYRTYYFREATGIGGSSMGGLMACYAGARYNQYFSKAACLSTSCVSELMEDIQSMDIDPDSRFWISVGTEEANPKFRDWLADKHEELKDMLEDKGAIAEFYLQQGGHHNEASWSQQVESFMNFLW